MKNHYLLKLLLLLLITILIYLFIFYLQKDNTKDNTFYVAFIPEGVYLIKKDFLYLDVNFNNEIPKQYDHRILAKEFKIYKADTEDDYYYIEDKKSRKKLGNKELNDIKPVFFGENDFKINKDYVLWNLTSHLTRNNTLVYTIQNKYNKQFLTLTEKYSKLKDNEFQIIRIYIEKNNTKNILLDNEPIDVLIKYIDLNDPNLNRSNIKQIRKDIDNNELKYSLRSILKNIPWIRKIFILMPNEKVHFLKNQMKYQKK